MATARAHGLRRPGSTPSSDSQAQLSGLVEQTLDVQRESEKVLGSAVATAHSALETGIDNSRLLHAQGEQLKRIDKKLDVLDNELDSAEKQMSYFQKVSRSFLLPVIGKRPPAPETLKLAKDAIEIQKPPVVNGQPLYGPRTARSLPERYRAEDLEAMRKYVGAWASEEQQQESAMIESRIDGHLDGLADITASLHQIASDQGEELRKQNQLLSSMNSRVDGQLDRTNVLNQKAGKALRSA
ncbi:uncharacterized protein BJ171DRAFT_505223 [Polychytrium aggregatum]|uniref:uncharacterized protein n=1 Tax=Polychytrium aggregatum TaxID=110093 RepID=UPI0022FE6EA6|nr:uncharacterized protein BJ171DRAFT_505223 [Polychytrium aggregatum]KAI9204727.1 hypothetical protein BJ171DRAFT_505223 [Polychytrium aggregatum]